MRVASLVVVSAIASASAYQKLTTSSTYRPARDVGGSAAPIGAPPGEGRVPLGAADGAVPDRTTVFDDEVPAVAKLDPALLRALRRAAIDAAEHRVQFFV